MKMNKYWKAIFMVVIIASLVATTGCNLKASTATTGKATATSEMNFITPTASGDTVKNDIMTQTAQAQQPAVATATATVAAQPEATQAPAATQAPVVATQAPANNNSASNNSNAVSIPTLTRPSSYTLQKGEWPICIARRFDLDLASLFSANGLTMDSRPATGYTMKIPSTGSWSTSAYGSRALHKHADYRVNSGDTVYSIACYFGDVSPEGILAANGFSSAGDVKSGNTIKIP
jgi:LysM repeat protein